MTCKDIRLHVEEKIGFKLVTKKQSKLIVDARSVYVGLCRNYLKDDKGQPISYDLIKDEINMKKSTITHMYKHRFDVALETNEDLNVIYHDFAKNYKAPRTLKNKLEDAKNENEILKSEIKLLKYMVNENEILKMVSCLSEDNMFIFRERIKPIIKMLNLAKY